MTKIVRLASFPPYSMLIPGQHCLAWISRPDTTLSQREEGILVTFKKVKSLSGTFLWKHSSLSYFCHRLWTASRWKRRWSFSQKFSEIADLKNFRKIPATKFYFTKIAGFRLLLLKRISSQIFSSGVLEQLLSEKF